MKVLGIETSCDETAVAVVEDGRKILSNLISSQAHLHEKFGGVVPEVASRAHVEAINPLLSMALAEAGGHVEFAPPSLGYPHADVLVELSIPTFVREEFGRVADVVPLYLRKSDAEIAWDNRARPG